MRIRIRTVFAILAALLLLIEETPLVYATELTGGQDNSPGTEEPPAITFTGLAEGDLVEAYRIIAYQQTINGYAWSQAVGKCLEEDKLPAEFADLTPEKFMKMTDARAQEFCYALMKVLKADNDGSTNNVGFSVLADSDGNAFALQEREQIRAGYYLILPKGTNRIYDLKKLLFEEGKTYTVDFTESFDKPAVETSVENLSGDRGTTTDEYEYPRVITDDTIFVTGDVVIPKYSGMYSVGKRITNLAVVVSPGLTVTEGSLTVEVPTQTEGVYDTLPATAYSSQMLEGVNVFSFEDKILFFETTGEEGNNYYNLDGSTLKFGATAVEAMSAYNELFKTSYGLPGEDVLTVAKVEKDFTLIELSLDTSVEIEGLHVTYEAVKTESSSDTGFYNNRMLLVYSVSPLDSNSFGVMESSSVVAAYGIHLYLVRGDGYTVSSTVEEILSDYDDRITGVRFYLYRFNNIIYDGDWTGSQESNRYEMVTDPKTGQEVETLIVADRLVYLEDENKTYEYEYLDTYEVNSVGEIFISGIEPATYLIEQANFLEGWKLSQKAIEIEATDWHDEELMEGKYVFELVWLNYQTRYLPGTGKRGVLPFTITGMALITIAVAVYFDNRKSRRMVYIIAYLVYLKIFLKNKLKVVTHL